jgi:oligopeptide/dipeptide ABC transporter ATP-binding protein
MLKPEILLLENPTLFIHWRDKDIFIRFLNYIHQEYGLTIIVFTSDLGFIRKYGDRVGILHMGRLIELGDREEVINEPRHPYTKLLMETDEKIVDAEDLSEFSLDILNKYVDGCRYFSCKYRREGCDRLETIGSERRFVKCVLYK